MTRWTPLLAPIDSISLASINLTLAASLRRGLIVTSPSANKQEYTLHLHISRIANKQLEKSCNNANRKRKTKQTKTLPITKKNMLFCHFYCLYFLTLAMRRPSLQRQKKKIESSCIFLCIVAAAAALALHAIVPRQQQRQLCRKKKTQIPLNRRRRRTKEMCCVRKRNVQFKNAKYIKWLCVWAWVVRHCKLWIAMRIPRCHINRRIGWCK